MTRLILIRHGETNWNVERRKQGRNDQPLNEKGATQAALAAAYVKDNFNVTKVWSSPLQRCSNTAALFNMPVATSDHLLEIDYGDWEGKLAEEIEAMYPDSVNGSVDTLDPPGGEMRTNLPVRGNKWVNEANLTSETGDVVLVGHGGSMKGLLVALLDLPDEAMNNLVIDNCSVSVVEISEDSSIPNRLAALNITTHLASSD